jgi:hypothetical protein
MTDEVPGLARYIDGLSEPVALREVIDRPRGRRPRRAVVAAAFVLVVVIAAVAIAARLGSSGNTKTVDPVATTVRPSVPESTSLSTTAPGPRDTVSVAELGCAHPQPVSVLLQVAAAPAGDLQVEVVNYHNGSEATLFFERTAVEESTRRGQYENFDVPGAACPGNSQTIEVTVDDSELDVHLDATMQLILPPPAVDGVEHVEVSPPFN